ncbi:MAG: allantoinase AllB [Ancalomicrobiaceae bacterium]|nr:allantoinase AllB [Ancalomicrobiaceae bacterium]
MADATLDTLVTGGTLATEDGAFAADVAIANGVVVAIGAPGSLPAGRETIDATGRIVMPGVIDVHVHFREPGMTHKEDWDTGTASAALGGVTTVFEMPNTNPPVDTVAHFRLKKAAADARAHVDFGIYGLLAEHNLAELPGLAEAGVCGFKLFLGNTTGDLPCPSDGAVLEGFEIVAGLGLRCTIHAENSPVLFWRQNKMRAAGRTDVFAHLAARTDVVAVEALSRSAIFAEWTGARIHIAHESCAASLPHIRFFKARGVDMTVETLPQYLYLDAESMTQPGGEVLRMNPPIRQQANQAPLWQGLTDGAIDMISTDHAPHAVEEKYNADIWNVACGFPGVQTSLQLMLDAVAKDRLQMTDLVRLMCAAPARAFGLYGRKGVLRPGADADLVIVDPTAEAVLGAADLASRGKVSAYEGRHVTGKPVRTMVRGRTVALDGRLTGSRGWGRIVRPDMPTPAPKNQNTTTKAILQPHQRPW